MGKPGIALPGLAEAGKLIAGTSMNTKESIKELANRNITTEQFQKIISALRGPDAVDGSDTYCETLKTLTTARIRSIVAPDYYGTVHGKPLTEMEREMRKLMLRYAPRHFASHYYEACKAIKEVYYYDLLEEKSTDKDNKKEEARRSMQQVNTLAATRGLK